MWQPIETAPRDSAPILLWGKSDCTINGPNYSVSENWMDERAYILSYQYDDDVLPLGRAFATTECFGDGSRVQCWPTHWMPIKAPKT